MPALCLVPTPLAASRAARRLCDAQGGLLFGPRVATPAELVPALLAASGERRPLLGPLAERLLALEAGREAGGPFAAAEPGSGLARDLGTANPYYGRQNSVLGLAGLINRPENETEAGQMFLEFLYKEDVESQFKLSDISGLVPAHVQNLAREEVVNDPFYKLMVDLVSKEYDIGEIAGPFSDLFYTTMDMLIVNQDTIDTILQFGQDELQKMIDNGEVKYLR